MKSPFTNQSFADLLMLHAEQVSDKSSDDDASDHHAVVDFVDSMVQAIVINRASGTSLALPAVVKTIHTRQEEAKVWVWRNDLDESFGWYILSRYSLHVTAVQLLRQESAPSRSSFPSEVSQTIPSASCVLC